MIDTSKPLEDILASVKYLRDELIGRVDDPTIREIVFKLNSCMYSHYPLSNKQQ